MENVGGFVDYDSFPQNLFSAAEFADVQDSTNSVRNPEEPENIEPPSTDVSAHFTAPPTDCATTSSASTTHSDRSRESSILTLVMDEGTVYRNVVSEFPGFT